MPRRPRAGAYDRRMKALVDRFFQLGYVLVALLFFVCGIVLVVLAGAEVWQAIVGGGEPSLSQRFDAVLDTIGLLTIAVASLELGQTVLDEEVLRESELSAPTRVRRFLSRFLIVVVVSLAIECLVSVFQVSHKDPTLLPYAASSGAAAALLLLAWGLFVRQNEAVERLEPEALREVQQEDREVSGKKPPASRKRRDAASTDA